MQQELDDLLDVLKRVIKLKTGIAQLENEDLFAELSQIHELKIQKFKSGLEHNGWVVPKHWQVEKAEIWDKDKLIFDGKKHHLSVGGSSTSFVGSLSKESLSKHVNTSIDKPEAFIYNPLNNLRPWQQGFSFSIPYNEWKNFGDGPFEVNLETVTIEHEMLVGTCFHKGKSSETIVFNAHTCHPMQLNDGLSGVFLILRLFKWLSKKETRYSYLGVIAPEHLGTIFYLSTKSEEWLKNIKHALFLESLASPGSLKIQKSFEETSIINRFIEKAVIDEQGFCPTYPFRTLIGNDETVWEAGGIGVSTPTLTRHPFETYHTQFDNRENFDFGKFLEADRVLMNFVNFHEHDYFLKREVSGLVALSNPKYDLYHKPPNPTIDNVFEKKHMRWVRFQDAVFQLLDGENTIFNLAEVSKIPFTDVSDYFNSFSKKGLISQSPVLSLDAYRGVSKLDLPMFEYLDDK